MADNEKATLAQSGKYTELPLRIASAVVLAAFTLFCTWMGDQTFLLLVSVLSVVIFVEFQSMLKGHLPGRTAVFAFCFLLLVFAAFLIDQRSSALAILAVGAVGLAAWEWLARRSIWGAGALAYAGLPFVALVELRAGLTGLFVVLFVFACVWGADTFAYFVGKTLGGPKLAPIVSPNKTWSGFVGGVVGAVGISSALALAFGYSPGFGAIVLAILLAFFSQIGDLFESWIKRRFGRKDSGWIIPGHGGLLDRIDGLIFAVVVAWLIGLAILPKHGSRGSLSDALLNHFFTLPL